MTVTLEQIREAVAAEYGITVEQLVSYRISPPYTEARRVFAALVWKHCADTPKQIAAAINRNNSWFYMWRKYPPPRDMERRVMARLSPELTVKKEQSPGYSEKTFKARPRNNGEARIFDS